MNTVKDLMKDNVETIHPEERLKDAALKMKKFNIGALPVCDGDRLKGMLTDRDIVVRSVAATNDLGELRVKDVMSSHAIAGHDTQSLKEAANIMKKQGVRLLPIVNDKKHLVGILSLEDIATKDKDLAAKTLQHIARKQAYSSSGLFGISVKTAVSLLTLVGAIYFWKSQLAKRA